jgi:hypothetical protein
MTYGQTVINKAFRDTFHFKITSKCCQWNSGTLTVTYKALQSGPKGSSTSADDSRSVNYLGASVPGTGGYVYTTFPVTAGTTVTTSYTIPADIVASGRVSFSLQDDSAVVSATLVVTGCCLDPTPVRGGKG